MASEREIFQKAFGTLKPACDAFITEPNSVNTDALKKALAVVPEYALEKLQTYVLIPLNLNLKTNKSNCISNALDVLIIVLKKTSVSEWPTFFRLYMILVEKLSDQNNPEKVTHLSEEIKLSIVIALNLLIEKADRTVLNEIYNQVGCQNVGYLIYLCTKIVQNEQMNILRVEAIKCITILLSMWDKSIDTNIRLKIIQNLSKFVPGVLSMCSHTVNATDTQHHSIAVASLNLWSTIMSLIVCDEHIIEEYNPYLCESNSKNENGVSKLNDWIQENKDQFRFVTSKMILTRDHQHWRVRLQLVSSCDTLLKKCSSSMKSSVTILIETLIILSDDEQPEVEKLANESVDKLNNSFDGKNKKSLIELLEESFYVLLTRIPRFILTSNYIKQKTELSLLYGYIKLFGKTHLPRVLNSHAHLDRLITVLIQILELDYKTISLLEEPSIRDLNNIKQSSADIALNVPWKQLIHFKDVSALEKIENICKLIGVYGNCNFIGRYLMDIFESKISHHKEITFLLNMVLSENHTECCYYDIVSDVMELYLERNVWYLPFSVDKNCAISLAEAQKNVVQICLMTEGLALMVSSLHVTKRNLCLIHCLYPILERVGSEIGPISLAGQRAVTLLAQSCGYNNPVNLVVKNSDYLSHHFTTRLWSLDENPEVLNALKVVMNLNGSDDLLLSFHSIVTDVLVQSYDAYRVDNIHSFMKVFHIFVMFVNKWQQKSSSETKNLEEVKPSSNCVIENILMYHKMMTCDFDDEHWECENNSNIPNEAHDSEEFYEDEKKKPLPPYIQMVLSIMKRVIHFSTSTEHHFLPLQILNEGLIVISNYENELLPMVHKMWLPVHVKFNDNTDDIVYREAFNLLSTMGSTAKDFILHRILKSKVLENIVKRLTSKAKNSKNVKDGSVYFTSPQYKLQYTILSGLGDFVVNLKVLERYLYDVLIAATHYLDRNQPIMLQNKSMEFFKKVSVGYSDFVWIYLQSLCIDEQVYKSDDVRLPEIKVRSSSEFKKSSITKNVLELLELLNV